MKIFTPECDPQGCPCAYKNIQGKHECGYQSGQVEVGNNCLLGLDLMRIRGQKVIPEELFYSARQAIFEAEKQRSLIKQPFLVPCDEANSPRETAK